MVLWKIYFWVYTTIVALGTILILLGISSIDFDFRVMFDIVVSIFGAIAVYAYVFKKTVFTSPTYWITILVSQTVSLLGTYLIDLKLFSLGGFLSFLLEAPMYYAVFKLATAKKLSSSKKSKR